MNWRVIAALAAGLAVASCGGNPLNNTPECDSNPLAPCPPVPPPAPTPPPTEPPAPPVDPIPEALRGNLRSATYSPEGGGTLSLVIDPLGTGGRSIPFKRDASLDTDGYQAFTWQDTNTSRYYVALFDTSAKGAVSAGVVGSGQFTEMVWGSTYAVDEAFSRPTDSGIATYSGSYAGLLNGGDPVDAALPPGDPAEPNRPFRTTGKVIINADFNAPAPGGARTGIEGSISGRRIVDTGTPLQDVFLQIATINPDGTFGGTVVFRDTRTAGTYAGAFGGAGASGVAGAVEMKPIPGADSILERGAFVADLCAPGDPSPCPSSTAP